MNNDTKSHLNGESGIPETQVYDCAIIGGGAAGLMCAASLVPAKSTSHSSNISDFRGIILEGTSRVGTKLLASGSGQCNITHAGSIKEFITHYNKSAGKLRSIIYRYNNEELVHFLNTNGIPTVTTEEGKVFPSSMRAKDILDLFLAKASNNGFEIRTNYKVTELGITNFYYCDYIFYSMSEQYSFCKKSNPCFSRLSDSSHFFKNTNFEDERSMKLEAQNVHHDSSIEADGAMGGAFSESELPVESDTPCSVEDRDSKLNLTVNSDAPHSIADCNSGLEYSMESGATAVPLWTIHSGDSVIYAHNIVVATGGCSYPQTGSDGSMLYVLEHNLRVKTVPTSPALVPIKVYGYPYTDISGISIQDATVNVSSPAGKGSLRGPVLFTHRDFSGPAILNTSRFARPGGTLTINYLGDISTDEARARIEAAAKKSKADYSTIIANEFNLPKRFAKAVIDRLLGNTGTDARKSAHEAADKAITEGPFGTTKYGLGKVGLRSGKSKAKTTTEAANAQASTDRIRSNADSRNDRNISTKKLAAMLTCDTYRIDGTAGYSQAMATSGGVAISEINTKTMELKAHPHCYIIGEALDVDGDTGGYNLQFAYSSARAAAKDIAEKHPRSN